MNIKLVEGNTKHLNISVKDDQGKPKDLKDFTAFFYVEKLGLHKQCDIDFNILTTVILPKETAGKVTKKSTSFPFEIRIFNGEDEIYTVLEGDLVIEKTVYPNGGLQQ